MITTENLCKQITDDQLTGWQMFYLASVIIRRENEVADLLYDNNIAEFIKVYYTLTVNDTLKSIYNYHQQKGFKQHDFDFVNQL